MTPVIAAVISAAGSIAVGILSLVGVILTNSKSNGNIQRRMEINQAITGPLPLTTLKIAFLALYPYCFSKSAAKSSFHGRSGYAASGIFHAISEGSSVKNPFISLPR